MHRETSPEERLLALIKGKHKKSSGDELKEESLKVSANDAVGEKDKRGLLLHLYRFPLFKSKIFEATVLRSINKYLTVIFAALFVYVTYTFIFSKPYKETHLITSEAPGLKEKFTVLKEEPATVVKDYAQYASELSTKGLFSPVSEEPETQAQPIKPEEDISKDLNLVGIIAGENPQAIIENKKSQKIYYLKAGESFNGFTIEDISDGKVVLNYGERKITLIL